MRRLLLLALFVFVLSESVSAAPPIGILVSTHSPAVVGSGKVKYIFDWTSSAAGDVSGHLLFIRHGRLIQILISPAATAVPANNYDVVLNNSVNVDYLFGAGMNSKSDSSTFLVPINPVYHDGLSELDLVISNAGSSARGTVTLWMAP